jgi:pimeloyl-ACP methyl ester carboxylesterase
MLTRFRRFGSSVRSQLLTIGAMTAWRTSHNGFWLPRRQALRWPAYRWAASSRWRSRQAPERVEKLALLDTSLRPDAPEQTERRRLLMGLAKEGRYAEIPEQAFPIYVHRKRHGDEALKRIVREMPEATGIEAYLRQQQAILSRRDSRPRLAAISCPTLVLVGEGDEATPPELAREIAEGIRGSRLVVVPDSGHLSTLEQPAMVTKALVEWLKS